MLFKNTKPKVFCIGFNKTGTTTLAKTLKEFDYNLGNQPHGELLFFDWYARDFKKIIALCKSADAFQDIPFSLPFTYVVLDRYFKDAKFVLTIRDNAEQWYNSMVKFHSKLWADGQRVPTADDVKRAEYRYKGYAYETFKLIYHTDDEDLYNSKMLMDTYDAHNTNVQDYFKSRPEKLLIVNVSKKNDYFRLCKFLNKTPNRDDFPWENKT